MLLQENNKSYLNDNDITCVKNVVIGYLVFCICKALTYRYQGWGVGVREVGVFPRSRSNKKYLLLLTSLLHYWFAILYGIFRAL